MRFFGIVGFETTVETKPGVWEPVIEEREYQGDVNRNQRRWQDQQNSINDRLNISNEISILADDYMLENLGSMKYVVYGGNKWKITWINMQYPRVILTLSNIYNEENA